PRHRLGQSRQNVQFTLENEPELEGCEKIWVPTRIADQDEWQSITGLLDNWCQKYVSIPFNLTEYAKVGFDYSRFPPGTEKPEVLWKYSPRDRLEVAAALRRLKNNAAINNNGARNFALETGRTRAR